MNPPTLFVGLHRNNFVMSCHVPRVFYLFSSKDYFET